MRFIDEAEIHVRSGHGGPGAVSFRRVKFVPRGGPDGGDGGAGGDVIFEVDPNLSTLLDLRFKRKFHAEDGSPGDQQMMSGKRGEDTVIKVPPGTIIKDAQGHMIMDLGPENPRHIFLKGGRGGKGNAFFKTSVNQAPTHAQPGEPSQEADLKLELKLLADVGIIGKPNAGKSTLISKVSKAKPKIADYPFTTLVPNLGVVQGPNFRSFVMADIPGLIKGAHQGVGLGIDFLKHIERTRMFVHLIDGSGFESDPIKDYEEIMTEIREYDELRKNDEGFFPLGGRRQQVVINKIDLLQPEDREKLRKRFSKKGIEVTFISGVSGEGVTPLVKELVRILDEKSEDKIA